MPAIVIAGLVR